MAGNITFVFSFRKIVSHKLSNKSMNQSISLFMKNYVGAICLICILAFLGNGCKDEETAVTPFLEIAVDTVYFTTSEGSQTIEVSSNTDWNAKAEADWVDVTSNGETMNIHVSENTDPAAREAWVNLSAGEMLETVLVRQLGTESDEIADDILIKAARAEASAQPMDGYGIEWTIDGNRNATPQEAPKAYYADMNKKPVELIYYFEDTPSIDYAIYYPAPGSYYGQWGEVEVWAKYEGNADFKQIMKTDCNYSTNANTLFFPNTLEHLEAIKFVVNNADGGWISCAEVEFYQESDSNFDPLTLFTDASCSELKEGITQADIDKCINGFYRNIAQQMLEGTYPAEFRIQEYKAYPKPEEQAKENKIAFCYSQLDNPTGIAVAEGEEVIVFAGAMHGQKLSIGVQELYTPGKDGYGVTTFGLREGVNKLTMPKSGLLYVMYNTSDYETAQPVKIHIASGTVNGYFDIRRHDEEDWTRLLKAARDANSKGNFDVLGEYAHLTFPVADLQRYGGNGIDLITAYDDLVRMEQEFMGLEKYDRMFGNRMYFHVMYTSYMYATSYRTAYNSSTLSSILDPENLKKGNCWGPAHEVGHVNQTKPGLLWIGMTEVTNNILALYVQTQWGNQSRLMQGDSGYANRYEKAMTNYFTSGQAHVLDPDVFCRLVPFWQLELYMNKVQGNADFYKNVYEFIRKEPNQQSAGNQQTEFVWNCCQNAQLDLTDFFTKWGFLTPIDQKINDYGEEQMTITEERIQEIKDRAANYPKPEAAIEYITDANIELFKQLAPVSVGSAQVSDKQVNLNGCTNAVAYEVCNAEGKLIRVSTEESFTLPEAWGEGYRIYAVAANGEKVEVPTVTK